MKWGKDKIVQPHKLSVWWTKSTKIIFSVSLFLVLIIFSAAGVYFFLSTNHISKSDQSPLSKPFEANRKPIARLNNNLKPGTKGESVSDTESEPKSDSETGTKKFFQKKILSDEIVKITSFLTWSEFSNKIMESNSELVKEFSSFFNIKCYGLFLEFKPFKPSTFNTEKVEFRLIKSSFVNDKGDYELFKNHIENNCPANMQKVIDFSSLDEKNPSRLIVPCPFGTVKMGHIQAFMTTASDEYITLFLKNIMEHLQKRIDKYINYSVPENDKMLYLSTSGHGVPWLHFRFDPRPKYFITKEYKLDAKS